MCSLADAAFKAKGSGRLPLDGSQYVPYATLALGSALAAFMYPHTLTGIFASKSSNTNSQKCGTLARIHSAARTSLHCLAIWGTQHI